MKQILWCTLMALLILMACHEKKQPYNIIVKKEKAAPPAKPQAIGDYHKTDHVTCQGKAYTIQIDLKADTSLPLISEGAYDYYDNRAMLTITGSDGSEVVKRELTKDFFAPYIDASYLKHSALTGIVYDRTEGGRLVFAASVGSPDKSSDDYVPLVMKISPTGAISVSKSAHIDTGDDSEDTDEEGI